MKVARHLSITKLLSQQFKRHAEVTYKSKLMSKCGTRTPMYHFAEGIDADVQSANISIHSACRKANGHVPW